MTAVLMRMRCRVGSSSVGRWRLIARVYRCLLVFLIAVTIGWNVSCDWLITEETITQGNGASASASQPTKIRESGSTTIRNLGLLIAGVCALSLAVWRALAADRQSKATERQSETATVDIWHSRFVSGVNMLASEHQSVRMCGAFELLHLLADSPRPYRIQLIETLSAFVRQPILLNGQGERSKEEAQAVLNGFKLRHELDALPINEAWSNVEQEFMAYTAGTLLPPWERESKKAQSGVDYPLKLRGADLRGLDLANVNLAFSALRDADLQGTRIANSDLSHAILRGANLSSPYVLEGRRWPRILQNYNSGTDDLTLLLDSELRGANFIGAKLLGTHIWYSDLSETNLWQADLSKSTLRKTDLSKARLLDAKLVDAKLEGSKFTEAILYGTDISGANFGGYRNPAVGLTQAQLERCVAGEDRPPNLDGVIDADTGQPLRWTKQ